MSTCDRLDLDAIRRRQERALVSVSQERPNEYDPDHCNRAAYILTVADVPALLAEVERMAGRIAIVEVERDRAREELRRQIEATRDLDDLRMREIAALRQKPDEMRGDPS